MRIYLAIPVLIVVAACGGGSSAGGGPLCAMSVSPSTKSIVASNSFAVAASGGTPPYTYTATSGSVSADGVFTAPSSAGSVTLTTTDAFGCTANTTVTVRDAISKVIVGATVTAGNGKVCTASFNSNDNSLGAFSCIASSGDTLSRGFGMWGSRVITGTTTPTLYMNDISGSAPSSAGTVSMSGMAGAFDLAHGICAVPRDSDPNGYVLLVGDYNVAAPQPETGEFSSTGAYNRTVFNSSAMSTGGAATGGLSYCHAASASKVFAVDAAPNSTNDGILMELSFNGSAWSTVRASSSFLNFSGGSMGIWSMVVHEDGYIYLPPVNPAGAGTNKKMVRCSQSDVSSCAIVSGTSDAPAAAGLILAATQIPGTNDILIATTSRSLYRYSYDSGVYTLVKTLAGADITNISQVRSIYAQ